jgi:hypothetical protein
MISKGILDRFEGDYALIEFEGKITDIPRKKVAAEAKEGDVLILVDGIYQVDQAETQKRKDSIAELTKNIWQ